MIGKKWQTAMTWLSMAENVKHWSKNVQSHSVDNDTYAAMHTMFPFNLDLWPWQLIGVQNFPFNTYQVWLRSIKECSVYSVHIEAISDTDTKLHFDLEL